MGRLLRTLFLFITVTGALAQTTNPTSTTYPASFTVAQDGSGNFKTIQEAVNAFRDHSQVRVTLYIKNGVYAGKLVVPSWKPNIHIIGESRDGVIITGNDFSGKSYPGGRDATGKDKYSTYTSYTVLVDAPDVIIENLTIRNTAGRVGQAVALHVEADQFVLKNCTVLGNQDTLFAAAEGSRQYYESCYIEGTVDFIFGKATAVFQSCTLKSLSDSYITAAATPADQTYGFVFLDCKLIADSSVTAVYLGRPWRPHSKTVFIRTNMSSHIVPVGWDNWRNPDNEKTAFYAECGSFGPGANPSQRASWSKQLTAQELNAYTLDQIFAGKANWLPTTRPLSQHPNGVTGVRDTSFTVWGTYQKLKPTYPAIQIVKPVLPPGVIAETNITYCQQNGRELRLDAYYPANISRQKRHPAVLLVHGGGWRSGDRSQQIPMAQQLAANGYVAITADYRLSTEALYPAAVHDLKAAIRWLRAKAARYAIDTTKIAVLGCSAGGQLAALLGATGNLPTLEGEGCHMGHSSAVQAVVDVDGILAFDHPESAEGNDSKSISAATYWFGGPKAETLNLWHEASALTYADKQTAPILFLNSSADRMHAGRDELQKRLAMRGIYSEVHTFADTPHPFWLFHPWFRPTMIYTITFLDKVLNEKKQ